MEELGIKKDAYYAYLKHLKFKAAKDDEGKAYLTPEQVADIQALRLHVLETGKIEGFSPKLGVADELLNDEPEDSERAGELAIAADEGGLASPLRLEQMAEELEALPEEQVRVLVEEASELAVRRLVAPALLRKAIADQMAVEDLPEELRRRVEQVQKEATPGFDAQNLAGKVLGQWRRMQQV